MSKELAFTDDNDVVKYLDTTTAFNLALTADGVAFDLTNAKSILVKIANDDGYIMQEAIDLTTVTSPLGGTLSFPINQDIMNTLVPDDYDIEVWVTMNDGTQAIFPSDGTLGFSIEENLMSDTGEVIPVITLNDFKQQFDDLSSQMENAVHNVQKGDKGDKGDTGTGLEIKDKVSSVSNLPSTANEGDGYLVGEELYVWVNGAWKDCGPLQGPKGDQGIQGNTGTGVSSTTIQYQISNSATTAPTGTWSNNIVATTTTNPYLWMKATLNYTDDTTKDFYLVSQKGDKGDTGATGATGPIGPQGPVGAGLVVKGTVNNASQLPTTGNQEGYCYFVGTDLYVWDAGAWKNCGSVSPDLSNYVTVTDLNNGLSTKVTDNKDGTEQLNGVQVQPFNKLSDTIGGRNILLGTQVDNVIPSSGNNWNYHVLNPTTIVPGKVYTISAEVTLTGSSDRLASIHVNGPDTDTVIVGTDSFPADGNRHSWQFTCPTSTTILGIMIYAGVTCRTAGIGATWHHIKIEQGSVATDWTPAPEDKVNVSDMRKPASDVVGLEDVSTGLYKGSLAQNTDLNTLTQEGIYDFAGEHLVNFVDSDFHWGTIQIMNKAELVIQYVISTSKMGNLGDQIFFRTQGGSPATWHPWTMVPRFSMDNLLELPNNELITPADDSKVVHDNHDGTIKINGNSFTPAPLDSAAGKNAQPIDTDVDTLVKPGLYYVSGSAPNNPFKALMMLETKVQYDWNAFKEVQIAYEISDEPIIALRYVNPNGSLTSVGYASPWVFLSDDSKVAHLSGDEEIAGTKTFDTAPIDKTTGHPYITKDSVPAVPDTLADTTKDANFTGKLQKSGIDVATTSDVSNAVNAITSNSVNWTSLSVDSSQISDTDYLSNQTNCSYRISHNALYISGQYVMSGNNTSSHNSNILFKLPTNIVSQISFPSTNKFAIGLLQSLAQQPLMMGISLTNDGKITCATNPYDLSTTSGASMASGFINAAIPLN